jgi:cystathionine beta-lyase/cystathionine gamma-synthase
MAAPANYFLIFPKYNIDVKLCDTEDDEELKAVIAQGCDVAYIETNQLSLKIADIERIGTAANSVGAVVLVDNTFAELHYKSNPEINKASIFVICL